MKNLLIATLAIISMGLSCSKSVPNAGKDVEADCPEGIMCTQEFRTVTITIQNGNGKPYALDNYQSTLVSSGEKIPLQKEIFQDSLFQSAGQYPILTDSEMKLVKKQGSAIDFIGFKGGKEVIKKNFVIGHDCCHIILVSGENNAVIRD